MTPETLTAVAQLTGIAHNLFVYALAAPFAIGALFYLAAR